MIGPLQLQLLHMMDYGQSATAADLHKALIRKEGEKARSYSTVLSVLRNLVKRRPDVLSSEKIKHQLVFTLRLSHVQVAESEFRQHLASLNWTGSSPAFLLAVSRLPRVSVGLQLALVKEMEKKNENPS